MRNISVIFVILYSFCFCDAKKRELPSFVDLCGQNDPNINECIKQSVTKLLPRLNQGIPELLMPPMNPLILPIASLKQNGFEASFTNLSIFNLPNLTINDIKLDSDNNEFFMDISVPKIQIKSIYSISGKILILQLNGQGPSDGNFTDIKANMKLSGNRITKNGKEHLQWNDVHLNLNIGNGVLEFSGLFKNNDELTKTTNAIINDNIKEIIEELRPVIESTIQQFVLQLLNRFFGAFSIDELFTK